MQKAAPADAASKSTPLSPPDLIRRESRRLFEQFGYAKTTTSDIAAACRMSPGNLYRHYRNKQAIGQAVVDEFVEEHGAYVEAALYSPAATVEARIRAVLTANALYSVRKLDEAPMLIQLAEMIFETQQGRDMVARLEEEQRMLMRALIEEGVAAGEFRIADADRAAHALLLSVRYFATPINIVRHGLEKIPEDLAITLDLVCAGLRCGTDC